MLGLAIIKSASDKSHINSKFLTTGKRVCPMSDYNAEQIYTLSSIRCHWHSFKRILNFGYKYPRCILGKKASRDIDPVIKIKILQGKIYMFEPILCII